MLFNSFDFIFVFLPATLAVFYFLSKVFPNNRHISVVAAAVFSLVFYWLGNPLFLWLILVSICVNYCFGRLLGAKNHPHVRKLVLALAVSINLAALGYFKYSGFFLENLPLDSATINRFRSVELPLGISFFTFTQIAYIVDKYRGHISNYTLPDFALFVSFFPHLVAGPVLYHRGVLPQIQSLFFGTPTARRFYFGLLFFAIGLFKKVLIADSLSDFVAPVFDSSVAPNMVEAWIGAFSYTLQLYFDFSGYSDMAVGLALFLNVRIPFNFNSPYKAANIVDFWKRWHITLSYFLKHYLYIPLGGNRKGNVRRYTNLIITMLLGGLWHGAGWNFVFWGGLHGSYIVINHMWRKLGGRLPATLGWSLTILAVVIGWVFFRAQNIESAFVILGAMAGGGSGVAAMDTLLSRLPDITLLSLLLLICIGCPNSQHIVYRWKKERLKAIAAGVLLAISILSLSNETDFLYRFF